MANEAIEEMESELQDMNNSIMVGQRIGAVKDLAKSIPCEICKFFWAMPQLTNAGGKDYPRGGVDHATLRPVGWTKH